MVGMTKIMALTVLTSLVLTGCADRGDWVGEWIGQRPVITPPGGDASVAASLANVHLTIKADGTFSLIEESFDKGGEAFLGSDTGRLEIKTTLGKPVQVLGDVAIQAAGERQLKLNKDSTITFLREGFEPVTLKRVES